jgi:putative acyl-CoA dehydrogenase
VADAFVAARLDAPWRGSFGTLPDGVDTGPLLERALPADSLSRRA